MSADPPVAEGLAVGAPNEGLTEFERQRLEIMARNRARLIALGLPAAVKQLKELAQHRPHVAAAHRAPRATSPQPTEPTRRSSRLAGESAHLPEGPLPSELADTRSSALYAAPRAPLTAEEIEQHAHALRARESTRLRELELQGLVDCDDSEAVFIVIGSHGDHYTVRLSDDKRTCQCMDHRMRRRDCKHIRLILMQLGIMEHPLDWAQAVERSFNNNLAGQAPGSNDHAATTTALAAPGTVQQGWPSNTIASAPAEQEAAAGAEYGQCAGTTEAAAKPSTVAAGSKAAAAARDRGSRVRAGQAAGGRPGRGRGTKRAVEDAADALGHAEDNLPHANGQDAVPGGVGAIHAADGAGVSAAVKPVGAGARACEAAEAAIAAVGVQTPVNQAHTAQGHQTGAADNEMDAKGTLTHAAPVGAAEGTETVGGRASGKRVRRKRR